MKKNTPQPLLESSAYGGSLQTTRAGRHGPRPLAFRKSMHLVLRSSQAKGLWSFRRHRDVIDEILKRFAKRYDVRIRRYANVGDHLHLQVRLKSRRKYLAFIRAITSAIMMAVTHSSRWAPKRPVKFWDRRPFTRLLQTLKRFFEMDEYLEWNRLERTGHPRNIARFIVKQARAG